MDEKRIAENAYELDEIRDLINKVQTLVVEVDTRENTIKQADQNLNELNKLRDLINKVEQSIVEVETQKSKIEWLRLYFALYFLQNDKSLESSSNKLTGYMPCDFQQNQSINVYGVIEGRYKYINTCEVNQLEPLLNCIQADWYDNVAIELFNEPGQMIPVAEVLPLWS